MNQNIEEIFTEEELKAIEIDVKQVLKYVDLNEEQRKIRESVLLKITNK